MLTITKVLAIVYLLCLCGNREYPGNFQNKSVRSCFKWVPKFFLFLDKLRRERKFFLDWTSIDLSPKLSLTCWENVSYYAIVHHVGIVNPWQFSKQVVKLSFQLRFWIYSLFGQDEGKSKAFFEWKKGCKKEFSF